MSGTVMDVPSHQTWYPLIFQEAHGAGQQILGEYSPKSTPHLKVANGTIHTQGGDPFPDLHPAGIQ